MRNFKTLFILYFGILFFPLSSLAQDFTVEGCVRDITNDEPLINAHIFLLNNDQHCLTDIHGNFIFQGLPHSVDTIKISFVGFNDHISPIIIDKNLKLTFSLEAEPYLTDAVIVSSSRIKPYEPLTYSEVSGEDLKTKNPIVDLPLLLEDTPSAVATSDAGGGVGYTGLRIRGSDLTRINVTLNGVPVNDAETHQVYFVDFADIASSVDNIQIQRGVGTASNGAASFGASINIKTDETSDKAYATVNSSYGSFCTLKNNIVFSTGRNNGFIFNGRISKQTSNGYIDRASSDLFSYYLSTTWTGEKNILKLLLMTGKEKTYQAWNGVPKDLVDTNPTYNPSGAMYDETTGTFLGYYDNEIDNYRQSYYQLHYAHDFGQNTILKAATFMTTGKGYYENFINDAINGNNIRQNWLDNVIFGFQTSFEKKINDIELNIGTSFNRFYGQHYGIIVHSAQQLAENTKWYQNDGDKRYFNIYGNLNYQLDKFNLFAEFQYRHIDYKIVGDHEDLRDVTQHLYFNFYNPKAGIFYVPNKNNKTYFSVAFSNREPHRDIFVQADEEQKRRIKHEKLIDYELGYVFTNSLFNINTNVFYMNYHDQLVLTGEINNIGAAIMTNVDKSYRYGLEISTSLKPNKYLQIEANLSLSQNKIKDFIDYVNMYDENWNFLGQISKNLGTTDISFSPSVIAGVSLTTKPLDGLTICLKSRYVGRQYIDNTSNSERCLDPYFLVDTFASYKIKQSLFRELNLRFALNNIFNTKRCTNAWVYRAIVGTDDYLSDGYFPQAKINASVGLSIGI